MDDAEERSELWRAALDALPQHVAVIDERGSIRGVNRAWVEFARANGEPDATAAAFEGTDYLAALDRVREPREHAATARRAAAGIRAVLAGETTRFSFEYPYHGPRSARWFLLDAAPRPDGRGAVIAHTDITRRVAYARQIGRLAHYDPLTGFASRTFFLLHAERMLSAARRHRRQPYLLHIDLEDLRGTDARLGAGARDDLLVRIAEHARMRVRQSDLLCRYADSELVALVEDDADARALGERYGRVLGGPFAVRGEEVRLHPRIEVIPLPAYGGSVHEIVRHAERARERARRARAAAGADGSRRAGPRSPSEPRSP